MRLKRGAIMWTVIGILILIVIIAGSMFIIPNYRVWSEGKRGEAEYMRAEQNRRIRVEEAKANLEAGTNK